MKNRKEIPSQAELLDIFEYRDGDLYWKPTKAGTMDGNGYIQTGIKRKYYKNHRIIYMMHHGFVPEILDHIDGNRTNNRIENLRPASVSENQYNRKMNRKTMSKIKGVTWRSDTKKWRAKITVDKQEITIGNYMTLEDAEAAITQARQRLHKEFANKG